ncbi:MAG: HAD hydrolase family protein [Verrucomicrobiales bacterium]|jgi:hydroxymethylpyrimidine pyrophosphatase-like HAD family hydrolase|nr:HAD hydrolase family protein [Verrucomicrobiales bacterium]
MHHPPILISTDFDGTLILDYTTSSLAPRFFKCLQKLRRTRRVVWLLNTGREWSSLDEIFNTLAMPCHPDWLALLEREIYRFANRQPVPLSHWNRHCADTHRDLFARAAPALKQLRRHIAQSGIAEVIPDDASPYGIRANTPADADRIAAEAASLLADFPEMMLMRNSVYARFAHVDFHKGSCLATIAREEGVSLQNIFAVGDHLNDLHMLHPRYASHLACPANAEPQVKQAIRAHGGYVARAAAADGVAEALGHFFGV